MPPPWTRSFLSSVMYYNYAGGVLAVGHENIFRVNGYSNVYWGWGNEDDDFSARLVGIMSCCIGQSMGCMHCRTNITRVNRP